jgi:hypothetical protein
VRAVTKAQVVEAFNDAFKGLEAGEVSGFKEALGKAVSDQGLKVGEEMTYYWLDSGELVISCNGSISGEPIAPNAVTRRLLEVYLDPSRAVSADLLTSIQENL